MSFLPEKNIEYLERLFYSCFYTSYAGLNVKVQTLLRNNFRKQEFSKFQAAKKLVIVRLKIIKDFCFPVPNTS